MIGKNIILKDTLLYISTVLISVGVVLINTSFWQGLLSCVIGAIIYIIRGVLKKKGFIETPAK